MLHCRHQEPLELHQTWNEKRLIYISIISTNSTWQMRSDIWGGGSCNFEYHANKYLGERLRCNNAEGLY